MTAGVELPPHISYSQVNTYLTCGEQYRLEKVLRIPGRPTWASVGGSAVHAATEAADKALFGGGIAHEETTFEYQFEREIAETTERSGYEPSEWKATGRSSKEWPNKENREWWLDRGPTFVKHWSVWSANCGWDIWVTPEGVPAIELSLQPIFGGLGDKMFIDRVFETKDGELVVVDLKTGSRTPLGADQLGDYAMGMEQILGVRPKYGAYWMARKGGTEQPIVLDRYTQPAVDHRYGLARKGMEQGIFIAHPSNLCDSCGVRDFCYAVEGVRAAEVAPFPLTRS